MNFSRKAFLVIADHQNRPKGFLEESLHEMKQLAWSCSLPVAGSLTTRLEHPSPSHFLREGKLSQVSTEAKQAGANVLYFNVELSPVQARNIEKDTKLKAVDRTGLILEIFGRRAKSREGKLQVELAQLNYALPRLGGLGVVLSRMGGGIGTRGPGEQMLESDRRKIRLRIQRVQDELEKVRNHRELLRSRRRKMHYKTAALVGYTNAGKSTLLNALTGADAYVEDRLFATLDPKTRLQTIDGRQDILFIDTVGFIRDLPHTLVKAFHATLEEVLEADVLLHVLDVSSPHAREQYESVIAVLEEIGARGKRTLLVLNKADQLDQEAKNEAVLHWPGGILISARQKQGLHSMTAHLESMLQSPQSPSTEPPVF